MRRFIFGWSWLLGITFPLLDFGIGAAAGALFDWIEPPTRYYPISSWLGFGAAFILFGAFLRVSWWALTAAEWGQIARWEAGQFGGLLGLIKTENPK